MKESPVVTLSTLVWTLILIFFYITSVKYKKFLFSAIGTFTSILFIFTPILWLNDGGLKGGYPYFLILFATMVVVVFRGKLKGAFLSLMVIVFLALTFLEMKYPNLVKQCPGKNCVYYNHLWGFLMTTVGVIILLNIFTNKYIEQEKDLEKLNTKLSLLSRTDPLTGLYNRRDLLEKIDYQMRISSRNKIPFSLIITDIDDFKKVNDEYGHNCGDKVLKQISAIFRSILRDTDTVARWGGEEFVFLLSGADKETAIKIGERIRKKIEKTQFTCDNKKTTVTISCGVTEYDWGSKDIDEYVRRADVALYMSKNAGKNCVKAN
jgi:diguanylate cyclase (GGDEF)-like protein